MFMFCLYRPSLSTQQIEAGTQIPSGDSTLSPWPSVLSVQQRDVCKEKIREINSKNNARNPKEVSSEWSWTDTQNWINKDERDT